MSWASDKAHEVAHYTIICRPGEDQLTALVRMAMEVAIARAAEVAEGTDIVTYKFAGYDYDDACGTKRAVADRIRALGETDR